MLLILVLYHIKHIVYNNFTAMGKLCLYSVYYNELHTYPPCNVFQCYIKQTCKLFMLILYSLPTFFPLCLSISFTVVNVLFKYRKSQPKPLATSGCTWLVKQCPLPLNSWLTHLCMRHMVDQKVLYNSYLHNRILKIRPCQRSCE